jgi:hypothetical protein
MDKITYLQWANILSAVFWLASAGFWLASATVRLPNIPLLASMTRIPIDETLRRQSRLSQIAAGFATIAALAQTCAAYLQMRSDRQRNRSMGRILILVALTLVVSLSTAQAAETTLMLACKGTVTIKTSSPSEYEPDPVSMGLIVNFTTRTVQGTARWGPYLFDDPLQITEWIGPRPVERNSPVWNRWAEPPFVLMRAAL